MVLTRQQRQPFERWPLHAAVLFPDLFPPGKQPVLAEHLGGPGGFTPLHAAALMNDAAAIRWLVAAGCPLEAEMLDRSVSRRVEVRQLLGLPVSKPTSLSGEHYSLNSGGTALAVAVRCCHTAALQALMEAGARFDRPPGQEPWLALCSSMLATRLLPAGDWQQTLQVLLDGGADCLAGYPGPGRQISALEHAVDGHSRAAGPMMQQLLQRLQHPASAVGKLGLVRLGGSEAVLAARAAIRQGDAAAALRFLVQLREPAEEQHYCGELEHRICSLLG